MRRTRGDASPSSPPPKIPPWGSLSSTLLLFILYPFSLPGSVFGQHRNYKRGLNVAAAKLMMLPLYVCTYKNTRIIYIRKRWLTETMYAFCIYMYHCKQCLTCLDISNCTYLNKFTLDGDQVIGLETDPSLPHVWRPRAITTAEATDIT